MAVKISDLKIADHEGSFFLGVESESTRGFMGKIIKHSTRLYKADLIVGGNLSGRLIDIQPSNVLFISDTANKLKETSSQWKSELEHLKLLAVHEGSVKFKESKHRVIDRKSDGSVMLEILEYEGFDIPEPSVVNLQDIMQVTIIEKDPLPVAKIDEKKANRQLVEVVVSKNQYVDINGKKREKITYRDGLPLDLDKPWDKFISDHLGVSNRPAVQTTDSIQLAGDAFWWCPAFSGPEAPEVVEGINTTIRRMFADELNKELKQKGKPHFEMMCKEVYACAEAMRIMVVARTPKEKMLPMIRLANRIINSMFRRANIIAKDPNAADSITPASFWIDELEHKRNRTGSQESVESDTDKPVAKKQKTIAPVAEAPAEKPKKTNDAKKRRIALIKKKKALKRKTS